MKWMRRLYDWVLSWAESPYGSWALFFLAFAESSFFPIPPDVLLIALAVGVHKKAFRFAAICTAGSVMGGMVGYLIGWQFMELVGNHIVALLGLADKFGIAESWYRAWDVWVVFIAGFTPIPYKVFTIAAGLFKINFPLFVVASVVGRAGRFFLVASLLFFFGPQVKGFIDRYFNFLVTLFTVALVGGFLVIGKVL
ncbi:MAG: DedA family protein [Desulfobacterales bacterium]|nr:DedA family protein [Desulfobacterales bacterium]